MLDSILGLLGQAVIGQVSTKNLAEQPMRRRLLALIDSHPGIHASELCRSAGEPWGTVQYHLALLHKGELVTAVAAGRERRFFPTEVEPHKAKLLALLHQGRRSEVVRFIQSNPGSRQVDVCDALRMSRKTFRASVLPLVQEQLVQERRGLQSNRYFPLADLAPLLRAAQGPDSSAAKAEGPLALAAL